MLTLCKETQQNLAPPPNAIMVRVGAGGGAIRLLDTGAKILVSPMFRQCQPSYPSEINNKPQNRGEHSKMDRELPI